MAKPIVPHVDVRAMKRIWAMKGTAPIMFQGSAWHYILREVLEFCIMWKAIKGAVRLAVVLLRATLYLLSVAHRVGFAFHVFMIRDIGSLCQLFKRRDTRPVRMQAFQISLQGDMVAMLLFNHFINIRGCGCDPTQSFVQ